MPRSSPAAKSGVRSGKATNLLRENGFKSVRNMKGGILAWSDKVDPSVPQHIRRVSTASTVEANT